MISTVKKQLLQMMNDGKTDELNLSVSLCIFYKQYSTNIFLISIVKVLFLAFIKFFRSVM